MSLVQIWSGHILADKVIWLSIGIISNNWYFSFNIVKQHVIIVNRNPFSQKFVYLICNFPIGILGRMRYMIVSTPDLCTLTYFYL